MGLENADERRRENDYLLVKRGSGCDRFVDEYI